MTERLIIDSNVIAVPIGVRDKDDPYKTHDYTLHFDISDLTFQQAQSRQEKTEASLNQIKGKYGALFDDSTEITEDNLGDAITGMSEMLRTQFDSDFGAGEYDKIAQLGGGNSFINMIDLYLQVNDFIGTKLERKFDKINQKSKNRQAKYMKKHNRRK